MGNFGRDRRSDGDGRRNFGRRDFGGGGGNFGGGFNRNAGRREMFNVTCSNCGKDCQVPFRPTGGKPVYCSECFEKINGGRDNSRRPERSDNRPQGMNYDQSKIQLDSINAKLDKILNILTPTPAPIVTEEKVKEPEVIKESPKAEVKTVKKVVKKVASKKK